MAKRKLKGSLAYRNHITNIVIGCVRAERVAQDKKFGDQTHLPDIHVAVGTLEEYQEGAIALAAQAKECCNKAFAEGVGNMGVVLLEEFCEAMEQAALGDKAALRDELVQCAAVCVLWIEKLDIEST